MTKSYPQQVNNLLTKEIFVKILYDQEPMPTTRDELIETMWTYFKLGEVVTTKRLAPDITNATTNNL